MEQIVREPTCRQVVDWATEWSEGSLDGKRRSLVEVHLTECADCSRFVEQLEATADLTRSWAASEPVEDGQKAAILEKLLASGREEAEVRSPSGLAAESSRAGDAPASTVERAPCLQLDEATARAYLEDRLPARQQIDVLEHLIAGCEPCRRACAAIAFPELEGELPARISMRAEPPSPELEARYRRELERLIALGDVDDAAIGLPDEVEPRPFLLWLIRQGRDLTESEPPRSLVVASIAVALASRLDKESQVRAAMLKAMVLRKVDGDFVGAESWFQMAHEKSARESKLRHLTPKVLSLWGFSKWCCSQSTDALELFDTALQMYRDAGDVARWGECAIEMCAALQEIDTSAAIPMLIKSSCVVDWMGRHRLATVLSQYLAYSYLVAGRPSRALVALEACRGHLGSFPANQSVVLRIDWTEASILNALGQYAEAAHRLWQIRDGFLQLDLPANAAFVSLDLAISLAAMRRWNELAEVAQPMAVFFISRGISGEAALALGMFREAVAAHTATVAQVQALRKRLG